MQNFLLPFLILTMSTAHKAAALPQKLIIAATEWAPLTSGKSGQQGLLSDITTVALKRVGYHPEIVILPWKRALEMTRKGHYDALLGTSYLEERTADFIYPNHAWHAFFHFHALQGPRMWNYTQLKSLCPATVGILIGSFHRQTLLDSGCLKIQENTSIKQSIQMLMWGRIDLYLNVPEVMQHYITSELPEARGRIVMLQPAYIEDRVYLVFPKRLTRSAELVKDYERGIELIKSDGTYEKIVRKYMSTAKP